MDTSSYSANTLVGGILSFPAVDFVLQGAVVKQEQINNLAAPVTLIQIAGSVTPHITIQQPIR